MTLCKSCLRLKPLCRLAPLYSVERSVSAMRSKPHAVVSETRRDLARLDKNPSNRYIYLIANPT